MALVLLIAVGLTGFYGASLGWLPLGPTPALLVGIAAAGIGWQTKRALLFACAAAAATLLLGAAMAPKPKLPSEEAALAAGLVRADLEPLRTSCIGGGCWAEARMLGCTPVDEGACPDGPMLVGVSSARELIVGSRIVALARLRLRSPFLNPSPVTRWPDTRPTVVARLVDGAPARVVRCGWLARASYDTRGALRALFERTLAAPHAGVARALLLGEAAIDPELNDAIRNAGVSHILAVSGMHVTVLVGGFMLLVSRALLWTPLAHRLEVRRVSAGLGVLLSPCVASVCGGSPSAVRAAVTGTLTYLLVALGFQPRALPVSALAVGVYAVADPRDALHPGFVLSVVATAALLTATQTPGTGLLRGLGESLRSWIATAPFLVFCFGSTSLVAVLANVVLLPVGALLIPALVVHTFAAALGFADALGTGRVFESASGAFVGVSRLCAGVDPGIQLPPPSPLQALLLCLLAGTWLAPVSMRRRVAATLLMLVTLAGLEWVQRQPLGPGELRVTFLDVGQGDGILVEAGDAKTMLIDAGGRITGGPDPGRHSVLPLLAALRIRRLDVVMLSHPHPDHYGGLRAVLEQVEVRELWDTGQAEAEAGEDASGAAELLAWARARGVRVRGPEELCGEHDLGQAKLTILSPCPRFDPGFGPNDNSFVLRLVHGQRSFLFTGDAEHATERALSSASQTLLRSDVLKVGHHGSRTSSTPELLARVQPWLSVVSAGRSNSFGHPHPEVVARLSTSSRHWLSTARHGGIRVLSDGERLHVRAYDPAVSLRYDAPVPPSPVRGTPP